MKLITKLILSSLFLASIGFGLSQTHISNAKEATNQQNIKLVGNYDMSQVSQKTMNDLKDIEKKDSNFHVIKKDNKVTVEDTLPNPNPKDSTSNRSNENTKVINFSDFVGKMDGDNDKKMSEGTALYSKKYPGQHDGQKVKKGTHVHCNRFNGTKADHKYWSKKHPRAYVDFYKSDCWYHAKAYKCHSIGQMSRCDGLNGKKKGVKDCSSWKGKPKHKNWPKTAWYRN